MTEDIICQNCGSVNDYLTTEVGIHLKATCNSCKKYIKFLPQGKPLEIPFGKYKGHLLEELKSNEEIKYLQWFVTICKPNLQKKVQAYLDTL